jgi:DNA invertase Pin-like site-specific DNA recombinase
MGSLDMVLPVQESWQMDQPRAYVAYCRVSTDKQGKSGLGLEAQKAVIDAFLRPQDRLLQPPYVEVESGRSVARPKLAEAMVRCRKTGACLLVAKLDRLSRNVPFLRSLIDGSVDVAFCDLPHIPPGAMGRFLLTQMAAVAELEAGLISERTKAALAAAKARGTKLGGDRGYRPAVPVDWRIGVKAAADARSRTADHAAHRLAPAIEAARQELGADASLHQIAAHLTAAGVQTPRGGAWTATAVRRAAMRIASVV